MPVIVFTSFYYLCTGRSLLALRALFTLHTNYTNTHAPGAAQGSVPCSRILQHADWRSQGSNYRPTRLLIDRL